MNARGNANNYLDAMIIDYSALAAGWGTVAPLFAISVHAVRRSSASLSSEEMPSFSRTWPVSLARVSLKMKGYFLQFLWHWQSWGEPH